MSRAQRRMSRTAICNAFGFGVRRDTVEEFTGTNMKEFDERRPRGRPPGSVREQFLEKISPEPNSGCWLWTACVDRHGYARLGQRQGHRVSYELHVGPIPTGLQTDHLCRVRCCVNPAHLELVTSGENTRRGLTVRRSADAPDALRRVPELPASDGAGLAGVPSPKWQEPGLPGAGEPCEERSSDFPETRECEGCSLYKPIEEMSAVFLPGTGESYQCEACRGG